VRNGASAGKTIGRSAWEIGHRVSGAVGLVCSIVAVSSGIERARVWGEAPETAKRSKDAYVAWFVLVWSATAGLDYLRYRERKEAHAHAHEELKEV
jgi:hypothetical protein